MSLGLEQEEWVLGESRGPAGKGRGPWPRRVTLELCSQPRNVALLVKADLCVG